MKRDAVGLQVSLDVEGRTVVVVGGDAEAEDKVGRLLDAGATVVVVARAPTGALLAWAAGGKLRMFPRGFETGDLNEADMVMVAERDEALATRVYEAAAARGVACWSCDDPERSDFAMPALARMGRARIAVSTSGAAPALASKLRAALERDLGQELAAYLDWLHGERERLRSDEPDGEKRRAALRALVEGFELSLSARYPDHPGRRSPG